MDKSEIKLECLKMAQEISNRSVVLNTYRDVLYAAKEYYDWCLKTYPDEIKGNMVSDADKDYGVHDMMKEERHNIVTSFKLTDEGIKKTVTHEVKSSGLEHRLETEPVNTPEILKYIPNFLQIDGWATVEKAQRLYELVVETAMIFTDEPLLSIELGIFGGRSLFPIAMAHRHLENGYALGFDMWSSKEATEGTNHPDNNTYWKKLGEKKTEKEKSHIEMVFDRFEANIVKLQLQDYCKWERMRTTDRAHDWVADNSVTILHQDSSHNIETISAELEAWTPKLKIGGFWIADDTSWNESKSGYAKLPSFGFELVEDHVDWQIWKKVK